MHVALIALAVIGALSVLCAVTLFIALLVIMRKTARDTRERIHNGVNCDE